MIRARRETYRRSAGGGGTVAAAAWGGQELNSAFRFSHVYGPNRGEVEVTGQETNPVTCHDLQPVAILGHKTSSLGNLRS